MSSAVGSSTNHAEQCCASELKSVPFANSSSHGRARDQKWPRERREPTPHEIEASFYFFTSSLCGLCMGHVFLLHLSGIVFGHEYFLRRRAENFATPARGSPCRAHIAPPDENDLRYFFSSLCGLCMGHVFLLHLSGIVFVPSIISEPHSLHIFPVGRALIAFLQSG